MHAMREDTFIYNSLGIPITAGVLYPSFGILSSPMIAAGAMSFNSVGDRECVAANACAAVIGNLSGLNSMTNHQTDKFIPALGNDLLTPLYDPFLWLMRETKFKSYLIEQAQISNGSRVLDLGCGTGT